MPRVRWRRAALSDLNKIIAYLRQFDPQAADSYADRLVRLGESLTELPDRGRPAADGTREMATVAPYVLSYRADRREIAILSIRHGRQRPVS